MFAYGGTLRAVHSAPMIGLAAQALLLAAAAATVGLAGTSWVVGAMCALILNAAVAQAIARHRPTRLGPASWVTLARATLAVGVAALAADSLVRSTSPAPLVTLAVVALALDWVDGQVARRTATESRLGAQMDGEVDAFLILALSVAVAPTAGAWVLTIGAARYAFLAAGWPLAWMRAPLPRRDWRKSVTAVQGIVLAIAAADALPRALTRVALAAALVLLAESFGRDVLWLWRRRRAPAGPHATLEEEKPRREPSGGSGSRRARLRAGIAAVLTVLAVLIVWVAL
ncbi:MAG TPA: CDP-alcohol phosphatidyltransferase family protein, partial [Gaiellales bacterium]